MKEKQNRSIIKIYNTLIGIIIFLIPTNFFLKFFENKSYINGLRVDYLIPKLYLSDIFILILLLVWLITKQRRQLKIWLRNWLKASSKIKTRSYLMTWTLALFAIFFARQFWSNYPISAVTYLVKIVELGLFTIFLIKNKKIISKNLIEKSILATLFFQSSIAIYQYTYQKSLFGYLLLGEPNLNNYIGIAKSTLFGVEKILPYGTTAHPNVLGGFLALYLLYLFNRTFSQSFSKLELKKITSSIPQITSKNLIISLALIALFLTQSASAIITLMFGLMLIFYQKYWNRPYKLTPKKILILTLSLFFISIISISLLAKKYPDNPSIVRRNYLNIAAIEMTKNNIFTGVGLSNFTSKVESFSPNKEVVRFVQPVHNIFLLFLAETGLLGLTLLILLISIISYKSWWQIAILLPIALLDHYLLTLNTGLLLIVLIMALEWE